MVRWLLGLLLLGGCSGDRVAPPAVVPAEVGRQALAHYDANGDGLLDETELARCPALKMALKAIDSNGDGRLSAEEIAARVAALRQTKIGLMSVACHVLLDGKPLAGATVTFVPEKFMGKALKPAAGVSDENGYARPVTEGGKLPGIPLGYFRVEVSKKNAGGEETLPARYNVQSILGQEVAPDTLGEQGAIPLLLTSR